MTFDELLVQVRELLQSKGRVTYRALKRRFDLDEEYLEDLKAELVEAERVAADEDGKVLVWIGAPLVQGSEFQVQHSSQLSAPSTQPPAAERRQLTVMFCDLVGSTGVASILRREPIVKSGAHGVEIERRAEPCHRRVSDKTRWRMPRNANGD